MQTDNFTEGQIRKAQLAKAFSDPANIAIFEFLIYHEQCVCGDLVKEIPISETTA